MSGAALGTLIAAAVCLAGQAVLVRSSFGSLGDPSRLLRLVAGGRRGLRRRLAGIVEGQRAADLPRRDRRLRRPRDRAPRRAAAAEEDALTIRVCLFGTYDRTLHPRVANLELALRAAGAEVIEVHEPAWQGSTDREDRAGPQPARHRHAAADREGLGAARPRLPRRTAARRRAGRVLRTPRRLPGAPAGGARPGGAGPDAVGLRHDRPRPADRGAERHPGEARPAARPPGGPPVPARADRHRGASGVLRRPARDPGGEARDRAGRRRPRPLRPRAAGDRRRAAEGAVLRHLRAAAGDADGGRGDAPGGRCADRLHDRRHRPGQGAVRRALRRSPRLAGGRLGAVLRPARADRPARRRARHLRHHRQGRARDPEQGLPGGRGGPRDRHGRHARRPRRARRRRGADTARRRSRAGRGAGRAGRRPGACAGARHGRRSAVRPALRARRRGRRAARAAEARRRTGVDACAALADALPPAEARPAAAPRPDATRRRARLRVRRGPRTALRPGLPRDGARHVGERLGDRPGAGRRSCRPSAAPRCWWAASSSSTACAGRPGRC